MNNSVFSSLLLHISYIAFFFCPLNLPALANCEKQELRASWDMLFSPRLGSCAESIILHAVHLYRLVSAAVKIKGPALSSFYKGELASAPSSVAKGHPPSIQDQINHKWYSPPPELQQNEFLSRLARAVELSSYSSKQVISGTQCWAQENLSLLELAMGLSPLEPGGSVHTCI